MRFPPKSLAALVQVVDAKIKQGVRKIGSEISMEKEGVKELMKRALTTLQAGEKKLRTFSKKQFAHTVSGNNNVDHCVFIEGELTGDGDLAIDGRVTGKIELRDHNLVIGPNGNIKAEINAKNVTVIGSVAGNMYVREMVDIKSSGFVEGDVKCSRISIAVGAHFRGSVHVERCPDKTNT